MFLILVNKRKKDFFYKRMYKHSIFGIRTLKDEKKRILIHMSSVGEFNLSKELIKSLLEKKGEIILSIVTDTGYEMANKVFKNNENIKIIYFPLDEKNILEKIYEYYNIYKTIVIETEIWPNLYDIASKNGELFIVNGRLTEKKMKYYMMFSIIRKTLNKANKIIVQSLEDMNKYIKLGIEDKNKLYVYKNLKYSIKYELLSENKSEEYYRNNVFKNKKIIVCGSIRSGEEKIWIQLFKKLNSKDYQLILVPRHLENILKIEKNLEKYNLKYAKLSQNIREKVLIVDKIGVLRDFYQMADFVFVGGTLVDKGGHSILEPLFYGKIPIIGKYYQNIEEIVEEAKKLKIVKIVNTQEEILEILNTIDTVDTRKFFEKNNELDKILKEIDLY